MASASRKSGGCLCGAVRYTALVAEPHMDVCHCGMCRRWSGGTFMAVSAQELKIEDDTQLGVYKSSDWAERLFCKSCGTSLFWRMTQGGDFLAASFQSLDDTAGFSFTSEIFIDEKPDLYSFAGARARKTGAQVIAEFGGGQA